MVEISEVVDLSESSLSQTPSPLDKEDVTVVIPTLNEEGGLGWVVKALRVEGFKNLLIIDGKSIDHTVEVAENLKVKVITQEGKGKAGAIVTAINRIKTPYFVVIDADHTYAPEDIQRFLDNAPFNHIIGRRMNQGNIKPLNRFGNRVINKLFNIFFDNNLHDVCSGLYMLKTSFAKEITLESNGFDVEVEITAHSALKKCVTEVPISYRKRIGIQKLNPMRDGYRIILKIITLGKRYAPKTFWMFTISGLLLVSGLTLQLLEYLLPFSVLKQSNVNYTSILSIIIGASSLFILLMKKPKQNN